MLPLAPPVHHHHPGLCAAAPAPSPQGRSPPPLRARSRLRCRPGRTPAVAARARPPSARAGETETSAADDDASSASSSGGSVLSFLCPLLKFIGGGDPSQERNDFVEVTTSSLSSLARLPWGSSVSTSSGNAPTLQLFPLLVDASNGVTMYESGDIVKYLFRQYGQGKNPSFGLLERSPLRVLIIGYRNNILTTMLIQNTFQDSTVMLDKFPVIFGCSQGWVPTLLRAGRGMTLWNKAGVVPEDKLELFSFENNTFARIVREALCELEVPYILQNVGEGSSKTDLLQRISGSKQVPYLIDPNTGFQSGDHKKILSYLFQQYSTTG
uniref:GST N-terminal domain-containing protein n=1 Tax=Leersia perrieri TaxID=77586 RepID=A0A0D9W5E7_9ORYZ